MATRALTTGSVTRFLRDLASSRPTPGGGSAAAVSGALGAALYSMVLGIVLARRLPAAQRRRLAALRTVCERHRRTLERLIDEDAVAYGRLVKAWARSRRQGPSPALQASQRAALAAPLKICEAAMGLLEQSPALARAAGRWLVSDVTAGSALLVGSFAAAAATVAANLDGLDRPAQAAAVRRQVASLWQSCARTMTQDA